ncbi:glycerophosphoryl diester phosphodiesterase protein [Rutstroemia sp. NJR-2017a BBW]|nr:glycerophosphoryl diester phosphodiesterase protein [Rutstroemia sp. NJR-2017a BBW]
MSESTPLLREKMETPSSKPDRRGRILPQAIAHRGYKAAFPENTMGAFRGAVEVGAHAIETDLHIAKDGTVVISHDPTLKRCFGKEDKIIDCDWPYLSTLRTIQPPHEGMPRLIDLLEYLTTPGLEDIWILLDIKAKYLPLCATYLPEFPIAHIGFSIAYAREFLQVRNVHFNMLRQIMVGPYGAKFLSDTKKANRSMFIWTVNKEQWMRWCISKGVDGVITDDPKKYLEVCDDYDSAESKRSGFSFVDWMSIILLNLLAMLFSWLFRCRYGFRIDQTKVREGYEASKRALTLPS